MGFITAWHQPSLRRPYEQHPRPYLQHLSPLFWAPNDGRAEPSFHPPHIRIPPPLPHPRNPHTSVLHPQSPFRKHERTLLCSQLHPRQSRSGQRYLLLRHLRRRGPDLYLLHPSAFLELTASDGDGDAEDADDDVECDMVWAYTERDAVGGRGIGVWWCRGRRLDTEEGEGGEGEGEKGGNGEEEIMN